jgi:Fe-S-cluster-containing dehydrogenase component
MNLNRRKFLGMLGGATALGIIGRQTFKAVAQSDIIKSAAANQGKKRWAMVIDLKKLHQGDYYERCIAACNKAHNIPAISNTKHEIKWIWQEPFHSAFVEQENTYIPEQIKNMPVLMMCNHCDKPPCTNVCPTQATWKREDGIVMMDWHRCIGCRYCIAACPYGSRSFNYEEPKPKIANLVQSFPARTRGVVEKCTFCAELNVNGEYTKLPVCVEECENGALTFGDLNNKNSEVYKLLTTKFSMRRKPELGTNPEVYYLVGEGV